LAEAREKQAEETAKYWSEHRTPVPVEPQSVAPSKHGMQGTALDARPTGAQAVALSMHGMQGTALDAHPAGPQLLIYGKVLNVVDEGLLISVRETNVIGSERVPSYAKVLLIGSFPGFYDEDKVQAVGSLIGAYEYTLFP
jgi:hypothetical protein